MRTNVDGGLATTTAISTEVVGQPQPCAVMLLMSCSTISEITMPKFTVTGREVVYYLKVVEAESVQDVKDQWGSHELYFDSEDVEDTADFSLGSIEPHEEEDES